MSDDEFRTFMDKEGRLVEPTHFRLAVYACGIEPSLRRIAWRHLLNVYPSLMTGVDRSAYFKEKTVEYFRLRNAWQARAREGVTQASEESNDIHRVMSAVKKDVLRTDRRLNLFLSASVKIWESLLAHRIINNLITNVF